MSECALSASKSGNELSYKTILSYMLGGIADNFIFVMIVTFLMIYYTDSVGIPAATVATIFLVTRIWDTFSDLVWGWLFDNTHTRFGKFRPWLLFGGIACAVSLIATFSVPKMSMTATIIWAYVTYFLLSMSYTSFDVPYWALATVITRDPVSRNKVVLATRVGAMCGQWLASLITLPLLALLAHSWSAVGVVYGAFFLICALVNFMNTKEIVVTKKKESHSFRLYFELLKNNRPLIILMSFWFIFNFVISARVGFGLYYFKYIFHSESAMASYLGISTFLALLGALSCAWLISLAGKMRACIVSSLLLGVVCCLLFFSSHLNLWTAVIVNSLPGYFLGVLGVILGAMLPDTVAWYEYKNHQRVEGMVFSLNLFQLKLSGAIGGALTGYILALIHYVPNVGQSVQTILGINISFTIAPGILLLVAPLILRIYPLTEQRNKEVAHELALRDSQNVGQEAN